MSEKLNLSLDTEEQEKKSSISSVFITLILIVIVTLQILILMNTKTKTTKDIFYNKDLAIKFENRKLYSSAIEIWKNYLNKIKLPDSEKSKTYFKIANLYKKNNDFDNAIKYFYFANNKTDNKDLKNDIKSQILECFRLSGNVTGLNRELAVSSSLNPKKEEKKNNEILIEIGNTKITKSDFEKIIENKVDMQLSQYSSFMSKKQLVKQKEQMLSRITNKQKNQILMEWIRTELLYKEAVEKKYTSNKVIINMIDNYRKKLLSDEVLNEVKKSIKLSDNDLKDYYANHKNDFKEPTKAKVSFIKVNNKNDAKLVLKKIKEKISFEKLAKKYSKDKSANNGGKINSWIIKGQQIGDIGNDVNLHSTIFSLNPGDVSSYVKYKSNYYIFKMLDLKKSYVPSFEEVKEKVKSAKKSEKEQEILKDLFKKLKVKYKVIVHSGKLEK